MAPHTVTVYGDRWVSSDTCGFTGKRPIQSHDGVCPRWGGKKTARAFLSHFYHTYKEIALTLVKISGIHFQNSSINKESENWLHWPCGFPPTKLSGNAGVPKEHDEGTHSNRGEWGAQEASLLLSGLVTAGRLPGTQEDRVVLTMLQNPVCFLHAAATRCFTVTKVNWCVLKWDKNVLLRFKVSHKPKGYHTARTISHTSH